MLKKIQRRKNISKEEKYNLINRFNKHPDKSMFLEDFQKIMIDRLLLNREGYYHPDNVVQIVSNIKNQQYRRNGKEVNTDISGGFILSTVVEADFYILLQERIRELTGRYVVMDEFLHLLLTWFFQYYTRNPKKRIKEPLVKRNQNCKNKLISEFNKQFSCYYQNI